VEEFIKEYLLQAAEVSRRLAQHSGKIAGIGELLVRVFQNGGHLYACGNGGSGCDAMHLVEELVARYKRERPGIPAHHFIDGPTLTCWGNDYDYASAFERQATTLLSDRDVLVVFSTSGNSENVIRAIKAAKLKGATTVALLGKGGGKAKGLADHELIVDSATTSHIQEAHMAVVHLLVEQIEVALFGE
jgi:D-sedoheptulose 7-phosphate isomerase